MQIDRALVPLRPRNMWESADLGFILARQHLGILFTLYWVPVLLIVLCLWISQLSLEWASLILWWLKPMFEAPLTAWIGRAMFDETITWRGLFKLWRQSVLKGLMGNLLLRRFHWGRGINLCVIQLEGASGNARRQRQNVLAQAQHNAWLLLTIIFIFSVLLELALISFLFLMLPTDHHDNWWSFKQYFSWFEIQGNPVPLLISALIQAIIGPFFVCSAFMLYINSRTKLEAWDLDISARRMQTAWNERSQTPWGVKQRSAVLMVFTALTCSFPLKPTQAATPPLTSTATQTSQNAATSKQEIDTIFKDIDTFGGEIDSKEYVWKHSTDPQPESKPKEPSSTSTAPNQIWNGFATTAKVIFFSFLLIVCCWLLWRVTEGMRQPQSSRDKADDEALAHTIEIPDEHLPDNIALTAENCLEQGNVRGALALLYRGTLEFYADKRGLYISDANTEQEFWHVLEPTISSHDAQFIKYLIQAWVRVAYGHREASTDDVQHIIALWRAHYDHA